jgi:hypothetical protein
MNTMAEVEDVEGNQREGRSPAYPYLSLEKAIDLAKILWGKIKQHDARLVTIAKVWELGEKSSGFRQSVAALKQFGFIEYIGIGEDRRVKLTELATRIILDERPNSLDRDTLLKRAALLPKIHTTLWEKWGMTLPPDVEIEAELTLDQGFSKAGARGLISEYKKTMVLSGLIPLDIMPVEEPDKVEPPASQTQSGTPKIASLAARGSQQPSIEERIVFKPGQEIALRFASEPDAYTYKSLIAYLEFRLKQIEKSDE